MMTQMLKQFIILSLGGRNSGIDKFPIFLILCLFIAVGTGCQGTSSLRESLESPGSGHPPYTLGPNDKIRITVYEHEDLSGSFTVDDAGKISLPLIGRITAKGLTLPEVEQTVIKHLSSNQILNPKVSIDVIELRPFCVLGEVNNPGCFSYVYRMSANKAIATAGGYTYRAKKNEFLITREDGQKIKGDQNTPIFGGDMLEVFERFY